MKIRTIIPSLVILLILASLAGAEVVFNTFQVEANGARAEITWSTSDESDITSFIIERSTDGIEFIEIATFTPQGIYQEYRYIDIDLFKDSIKTFHYRIKAVDRENQPHYSVVRTIQVSLSGIQQTWGSLKAMFR